MSHPPATRPIPIGVSSWAVHSDLGSPPIYSVECGDNVPPFSLPPEALSLADLPARLVEMGFDSMQICHFHLPSREEGILAAMRAKREEVGLPLHCLLIDAGDITHPINGTRDTEWIAGWFPVAAALGAQSVRVIAGKNAGPGAMDRALAALNQLADTADRLGLQMMTENWFDLLSTPLAVEELLARCEGRVPFLLDFGNWSGPLKFDHLAAIAPHATATHAKAHLVDADHALDEADYQSCLTLPFPADFPGPHTLVNGGLRSIIKLADFIRHTLSDSRPPA